MGNIIDTSVGSLTSSAFGSWGAMIHNALAAVGAYLVEGPKLTGSNAAMTWGSQTAPFTANVEYAYEVWRLASPADAVESAQPVYIRFGFGSGTFNGTIRLRVKVGTTWAANGVVGGLTAEFDAYDGSGGQLLGLWMSCDGHGLACSHSWGGSTIGQSVFVVDRHRDIDGSPLLRGGVPTGVFVHRSAVTSSFTAHFDLIEPSVVTTTAANAPCVTDGTITTNLTTNLNDNGQTQVYPWWSTVKNAHGVSKMICTIAQADVGYGTEQEVGWLGRATSRTVKALGAYTPRPAACDIFGTVSAGLGLAIWWDD